MRLELFGQTYTNVRSSSDVGKLFNCIVVKCITSTVVSIIPPLLIFALFIVRIHYSFLYNLISSLDAMTQLTVELFRSLFTALE